MLSSNASKAYYNLNRDLFMRKLKEKAPGLFNLFFGKQKGSTYAFFYDTLKGVCCISQAEGGSPGAPEMSFGYELGASGLKAEVAQA